jgi:hypothetical protein
MHRSATTATPRRAATSAALALALAWLAWGATPARAQMIMGITTNSFTPGSSTNSLDVTLTNTGTSPTTIAGFSFEITAASNNVTFSDVTVNTASVAYIFAGNSLFGPDITLNVGNNGQTISGADNFATRYGGTTLAANQTLGLGNVLFALSPSTPLAPINITFTPYPTSSMSDPNPNPNNIPVGFAAYPQIGPTSVPELPPTALVVTGLLLGVGVPLRHLGLAKLLTRLGSH